MSVCHPGAGGLGRDGGPHQGDQRPNTGRAEENHLGGAGPAVGKHRIACTRGVKHSKTQKAFYIMLSCVYIYGETQKCKCGNC